MTALANPSKKVLLMAAGYGLCFSIMLWAAYSDRLPLEWLAQFPNYDKVGHVVLYFAASYLGHRLCSQKHVRVPAQRGGVSLPVFPGLFTLFTVTEELLQRFSPYRTLDMGDLICSVAGIVLGYWVAQRPSRIVKV